jgi:hypothetical protein
MKYATEMDSGAMIYIPNLMKIGLRHSKVNGGGMVESHTLHGDGTNLI